MDSYEFFNTYFPFIILTVVIIVFMLVITSIFGINFNRQKRKKVTRKVTFAPGI